MSTPKWIAERPPEVDVFTDKPGIFWAIKDERGQIISLARNGKEAHLIASAPALLAALKGVRKAFPDLKDWEDKSGESLAPLAAKIDAALSQAQPEEAAGES